MLYSWLDLTVVSSGMYAFFLRIRRCFVFRTNTHNHGRFSSRPSLFLVPVHAVFASSVARVDAGVGIHATAASWSFVPQGEKY